MSNAFTTIDLLRHGECAGGEIFRGRTDSDLTELGWQQMFAAAGQECRWQQVVCSPLRRCQAFANRLGHQWSIPVTVEAGLREIDFGVWEGQAIADVWQQDETLIGQYFADPGSVTPKGGEPLAEASKRVFEAWQQIVEQHRGQQLLLVTHGGAIRLLLAQLLRMPLDAITRLSVPHGSRSQIQVFHQPDGDFPSLVFHNPVAL